MVLEEEEKISTMYHNFVPIWEMSWLELDNHKNTLDG